ncbi:MAG: class I mannose-6-phosphate isomerase [Clostridia bacterium]|nr:class I mannose-6-phosphate isomerase [Clostridia bacterium]
MKYPMKLLPSVKDYVWGGTKLKSEWGKLSLSDTIAESWELSCHKDGQCIIAGGMYEGKTLAEVLDANPDYKGSRCDGFDFFPILIKLIDARSNLSIQVHPGDEYALAHEGQYGKTEMWYIVEADDGAGVYCGFKSGDMSKQEVVDILNHGKITDYLNFIKVSKGDVIFIPSGTVHAICGGLLICEIQQNSSLTYRLYDYDRVDKSGNKRQLHIDKAVDVIDYKSVCVKNSGVKSVGESVRELASCKYFDVNELSIKGSYCVDVTDSFVSLTAVEGCGYIAYSDVRYEINKGETYFLPAGVGRVEIIGQLKLISAKI